MLQQWVWRAFEARMDARLMSHVRWGWEEAGGWGKAPKGFPTARTLCEVPVPSHASQVPVCPLPLSHPGQCPAAGYKDSRAVGTMHGHPGTSSSLACCLPMLSSVGSASEKQIHGQKHRGGQSGACEQIPSCRALALALFTLLGLQLCQPHARDHGMQPVGF